MYGIAAGSRSKYATLASARVLLISVALEVCFVLAFLLISFHAGGYAFDDMVVVSQQEGPLA